MLLVADIWARAMLSAALFSFPFVVLVLALAGTVGTALLYPETTDLTATGYRAYIEEYRHDLQHPDYAPSQQHHKQFHDILKEHADTLPPPQASGCVHPLPQGLVEFSDFGPLNDLPFDDLFVVSPGHSDVTGKTHFAFLDAYGARLKGGELEVLVSDDLEEGGGGAGAGFQARSGDRISELSMHYEAAAMGYGRGDSQALAPPLRVRAVSAVEVAREVAELTRGQGSGCYCDILIPHKVIIIALVSLTHTHTYHCTNTLHTRKCLYVQ
jgi:hypothetical protein